MLLRRITALLAMLAIVGLMLLLMYDVYLHHRRGSDESVSVRISSNLA